MPSYVIFYFLVLKCISFFCEIFLPIISTKPKAATLPAVLEAEVVDIDKI